MAYNVFLLSITAVAVDRYSFFALFSHLDGSPWKGGPQHATYHEVRRLVFSAVTLEEARTRAEGEI